LVQQRDKIIVQVGVDFTRGLAEGEAGAGEPAAIAAAAKAAAVKGGYDCVLVDTAGRLQARSASCLHGLPCQVAACVCVRLRARGHRRVAAGARPAR
jgi:SRP54-type protein, GTPase domain